MTTWLERMAAKTANTEPGTVPADSGDAKFGIKQLVQYIEENYHLGRSSEGLMFAYPRSEREPRMAVEIRSMRRTLTRTLWRDKGIALGKDTIASALAVAEGIAEAKDPEHVAIRAAVRGEQVFIDLGDETGRVVRVTANGWRVEDPSPEHPLFRRTAAQHPLPEPIKGGTRDILRGMLRLDADDYRWHLAYGWLVSSVFADVSRPILWATGPQGSGKSTRARMLINVIDPRPALGGQPGKNEKDDSTVVKARFLASWDNISSVSQAVSDWFCRLVTGGEDGRRQLFSDDEFRAASIQRTGIATSIYLPPGLRNDATERLVIVPFERMPDSARASETALWEEYENARPAMLGALLDDISGVLRYRREAASQSRTRPRMADHADILAALDMATGDAREPFRRAYCEMIGSALADKALDDPFTLAVLETVALAGGEWTGTAKDLLQQATERYRANDADMRLPHWWPTSPRAVAAQLAAASESLKHAGVRYERLPKTRSGVPYRLTAEKELNVDVEASRPVRDPADERNAAARIFEQSHG